jgi:lipopolysaccharide transport system permease protein
VNIAPPSAVTVYTPDSPLRHPRRFFRGLLADLWRGRGLAWRLFIRDLSAQYRQTVLGYLWAFLPPLVGAATFIFLQSQGIVAAEGTGMPYAAFAMIGTLLWQTFVDAVQSPVSSVQAAKPMLAKVNFPRESILVAGLAMVLFNFLIRCVLIAVVMAVWRITPGSAIVLFPVAVTGLVACGFAIGLALLPIGALYGDVARAIPIVSQFLMLLTPVVYPARSAGLARLANGWNPISPVIITARESLTGLPLTLLPACVCVTLLAIAACFLGLAAYRLTLPILIERLGG